MYLRMIKILSTSQVYKYALLFQQSPQLYRYDVQLYRLENTIIKVGYIEPL